MALLGRFPVTTRFNHSLIGLNYSLKQTKRNHWRICPPLRGRSRPRGSRGKYIPGIQADIHADMNNLSQVRCARRKPYARRRSDARALWAQAFSLQNKKPPQFAKHNDLQCRSCKRTQLTLRDFPPPLAREFLQTHLCARRKENRDGKCDPVHYLHGLCVSGCGARRPTAILGPSRQRRRWFCHQIIIPPTRPRAHTYRQRYPSMHRDIHTCRHPRYQ